jgi:hypothetical protein
MVHGSELGVAETWVPETLKPAATRASFRSVALRCVAQRLGAERRAYCGRLVSAASSISSAMKPFISRVSRKSA